jgi:RNA polymerase sigma-70 factor (ECF subfamily)
LSERRSVEGALTASPPEEEFTALYREEAPSLWRALFAYTHSRDVASDATAEAFAQYLRRRSAVRSPKAWIWRSAFKIATGELARQRTPLPETPRVGSYELPDPDVLIDKLALLPSRQRATLILRYYLGYEPREIARILEINPATVRVHLTRGRRKLRGLLEVRGDD